MLQAGLPPVPPVAPPVAPAPVAPVAPVLPLTRALPDLPGVPPLAPPLLPGSPDRALPGAKSGMIDALASDAISTSPGPVAWNELDVGQNGRPLMGPQMEISLV